MKPVKKQGATLTEAVKGQFIKWRKGTTVWATKSEDGTYFVERRHWKAPKVTLMNVLAGVPASALRF